MKGEELLDYAIEQFENGVYDAALEAFILAYTKGFEQEWILQNIYDCYISGNEAEFRKTYETWQNHVNGQTAYGDCLLDFIPYREGEYYIYDKEIQSFRGVFSISSVRNAVRNKCFQEMEFSALVMVGDWDWSRMPGILAEAEYRKIYVICKDVNKCGSFFKMPELGELAPGIMLFSDEKEFQTYFHENTAEYLPRIYGGTAEEKKVLERIVDQEHEYRLTPEGRNTDNVLLSIGIPTHDRGNLLLKRLENLRQMPYDAEVEFAISKNGTHYYQEEYRSVSGIPDARINYVGYDKDLTFVQNVYNVIKIAHGKYVLMVSDEDDVIFSALEHYLGFLSMHDDVALLRAQTRGVQSMPLQEDEYHYKGVDAFVNGWVADNYLSGAIYNRKIFQQANILCWNKNYSGNVFYSFYPHLWWQAVLALEGDYVRCAVELICEGDGVQQKQLERYYNDKIEGWMENFVEECPEISVGSTYESRIQQFKGAAELLWEFGRMGREVKIWGLQTMVMKTLYLMNMVYEDFSYKADEYITELKHLTDEVLQVMEQWKMDMDSQKRILDIINGYLNGLELKG